MMKLILVIKGALKKYKTRPNYFSEAVSEAIKDTFREMGYKSKMVSRTKSPDSVKGSSSFQANPNSRKNSP